MATQTPPEKTAHREDGIQRFIASLLTDLPRATPGTPHARPAHCLRMKLRTVRKECGLRRMHESSYVDLVAALAQVEIHSRPMLMPGLGLDEWVRFSRVRFPEDTITFTREDALQTLLADAIGSYGPLKNLRLIGQEYRLSTGRRVDFLCKVVRGEDRGALVAIELKRTSDQRTAEQIETYLSELRQEDVARGRDVRGIVITGHDDPVGLQLIRSNGSPVEWLRYGVSLERIG